VVCHVVHRRIDVAAVLQGVCLGISRYNIIGCSRRGCVGMEARQSPAIPVPLVDMDFYIDAESNPLCIGNQLYLSAEEFIGTGGPYTFDWTSDPPGFYSNLQTPPPTQPDQTTTYFLVVSDGVLNSNAEVTVIVNNLPEANAGPDGTICGNETYQVDGTALYYDNSMWVTSGDGFFDDPTALSTFYTPGEQDNQAGSVTLTLIAHPLNPCVANAVDDLTLQVLPLPSVAPGEDFSVCSNDPINLNANAQYSGSINWTTSGDGTFSSPWWCLQNKCRVSLQ